MFSIFKNAVFLKIENITSIKMSTGVVYPLKCVERKGEFTRELPCEELLDSMIGFSKTPEREPGTVCRTQTYNGYNTRVTKTTCTKHIMFSEHNMFSAPISDVSSVSGNAENAFTKVRFRGNLMGFNVIDDHFEIPGNPNIPGFSGMPGNTGNI
jgi:hypothetical protein